jgi:hypothetical protein
MSERICGPAWGRGDAGACLGTEWRDPAVQRIDDEPRTTARVDFVNIEELGRVADPAFRVAAKVLGARQRVRLPAGDGSRELGGGDGVPRRRARL